MSCSEWQRRIAGEELDDPAVAEHLGDCSECRDFANELAENASALRSIEVDAAAYTALRARVMDAVRPRRRFGWLWAAGAIVGASVAVFWWTAPLRVPEPPRPLAIVYPIPAPTAAGGMRALPLQAKKQARRPILRERPLQAIKILTDDPNVVIIWLVDDKKGDSL